MSLQIETQKITKTYDEVRGLLPTNIVINKGEFVAIVGGNGAGKSTLLKLLAHWLVADDGVGTIDGIKLEDRLNLVRKIGFVPESPNLFDAFTVEYNFKLFTRLFSLPVSRIDQIYHEFNLYPFRKKQVQTLSKGLKQRVSLGRSLLADPPILLLDEPTSGLDVEIASEIYCDLRNFNAAGKTIVFTSHRSEEVRRLAARIIALNHGQVVFDGTPAKYFAGKDTESAKVTASVAEKMTEKITEVTGR